MTISRNNINRLFFTVETSCALYSENFRLYMVNKYAVNFLQLVQNWDR
jgi:hypothetical protein